jgi:hypothetical protein
MNYKIQQNYYTNNRMLYDYPTGDFISIQPASPQFLFSFTFSFTDIFPFFSLSSYPLIWSISHTCKEKRKINFVLGSQSCFLCNVCGGNSQERRSEDYRNVRT